MRMRSVAELSAKMEATMAEVRSLLVVRPRRRSKTSLTLQGDASTALQAATAKISEEHGTSPPRRRSKTALALQSDASTALEAATAISKQISQQHGTATPSPQGASTSSSLNGCSKPTPSFTPSFSRPVLSRRGKQRLNPRPSKEHPGRVTLSSLNGHGAADNADVTGRASPALRDAEHSPPGGSAGTSPGGAAGNKSPHAFLRDDVGGSTLGTQGHANGVVGLSSMEA
jgi:hypothetical protein